MEPSERRRVLELVLWLTDRPLKAGEIINVLGAEAPTEHELRDELSILGQELDGRQAPYQLMEVAQGFQLASRPGYSQWVRRLYKEKTTLRLSPSALETLSIVAYKQPITRGEIESIRGVETSGVLETLLERKLVKIVGRKEALGRPLLYGTTLDFMKQFGLRSLDELPRLEELVPPEEPAVPQEGGDLQPAGVAVAAATADAETAVPTQNHGTTNGPEAAEPPAETPLA